MGCFLIFILSFNVSGWSIRDRPGLFPFLRLSVHTVQNSWSSAGDSLLSHLVNIRQYYTLRHAVNVSQYELLQQKIHFMTCVLYTVL